MRFSSFEIVSIFRTGCRNLPTPVVSHAFFHGPLYRGAPYPHHQERVRSSLPVGVFLPPSALRTDPFLAQSLNCVVRDDLSLTHFAQEEG